MLDLVAPVRRSRNPGRAHHPPRAAGTAVLRRAAAARWCCAIPTAARYFTWDITRTARQACASACASPRTTPARCRSRATTEGFLANDLRPGGRTALCYDVRSRRDARAGASAPTSAPPLAPAQALLVAPVLIQRELRGRAIMVRESRRKFTRDDLEFLLVLVGQAAASLETVRLQAKAEEVAVLEERAPHRARPARRLHPVARRHRPARRGLPKLLLQRDPTRVPKALEELHAAVDRGYREVRHYLTVLRRRAGRPTIWAPRSIASPPSSRSASACRSHMARPQADPGLPASTAYELTQIVREALHNAVRHGQATQADRQARARDRRTSTWSSATTAAASRTAAPAHRCRRLPEARRRSLVDPRAHRGARRIATGLEQARRGRRGVAADPAWRRRARRVDPQEGDRMTVSATQAPDRDRRRPHAVPRGAAHHPGNRGRHRGRRRRRERRGHRRAGLADAARRAPARHPHAAGQRARRGARRR